MSTVTMIVPEALRDQCAALCELVAGAPGGSMFIQPLYTPTSYVAPPEDPDEDWTPPPKPEPTHYFSSGWIDDQFFAVLPINGPADYAALIEMSEGTVTQQQLESIFDQCVITDEPWREAASRLGLFPTPKYV